MILEKTAELSALQMELKEVDQIIFQWYQTRAPSSADEMLVKPAKSKSKVSELATHFHQVAEESVRVRASTPATRSPLTESSPTASNTKELVSRFGKT